MADPTNLLLSALVSAGIGVVGTWLTAKNQLKSKQLEVVPPTLSIIMETWRTEIERLQERNATLEARNMALEEAFGREREEKLELQERVASLEITIDQMQAALKRLAQTQ